MKKELITQVQETQRVPNRINPRQNTPKTHINKINKDQTQRANIKSPEINPCIHGHLIFNKGGKNINEETTISLTSGAGKTGQPLVSVLEVYQFY